MSPRRWATAILLTSATGYAQISMPVGFVHGDVVAARGSAKAGELTIKDSADTLYGCSYDARTYAERDHWPVAVSRLAPGDPVEVMADRRAGSGNCYIRTIRVVEPSRIQRPAPSPTSVPRAPRVWTDLLTPRGNLTFGGVVVRLRAQLLTLKTRAGEVTLQLRRDTRFLGDGLRVNPDALLINTHVFIRGGRTIEGRLEAYQVIWGQMLLKP